MGRAACGWHADAMTAESGSSGQDHTDRAAALVCDVAGEALLGCYAHGSAVRGGLRPASDVDLLAVVERSLDGTQRDVLTRGLLDVSGIGGGLRPVELTVVVRDEVVPWRFPPWGDYLYGEWLRERYEAGRVPEPERMPDLALAVTSALAGDRTLAGRRPAEVLAPVPRADVVRASLAGLDEVLAEVDSDTRNVVLTVARVWATAVTGEVVAKDEAAGRAARRLPDEYVAVVEHARELYLGSTYADEVWPEHVLARVHACVEWMAQAARQA